MKRRDLSDEERALWRRAVRDVAPTKRARAIPIPASASTGKRQPAEKRAQEKRPGPPAMRPAAKRAHAVVGGGDPRLDKRAARGRLLIEARLDLHGLTQSEAHRRFCSFLEHAHAGGARLALVITGKGRGGDAPRQGVLKARFLEWVEEPPARAHIARVAPASRGDGGAGAFYVFLKSKSARTSPRS
ncbi:MAG: Smr/MutS family protein [Parvularculaceae bacterium]|nr:Smr/MutS family protein [Parvularculaceae bacterium]